MADRALKPGWTWVKFSDVVRLNTDRIADPEAEGIERYVGIEHIEPEDLRIRSWGLVAEGTTFTNFFKPGQVLFVKRRAYQRKVAVAEFEGVCSGDIYVLEPQDDRLLPDLLPFICQTESFFAHAVNTSAGSLSPRTNWRQLSEYEFALPPLAEQRRIAGVASASLAVVDALRETLDSIRTCERASIDRSVATFKNSTTWATLVKVLRGSPESGCSAPPRDSATGHWVLALSALSELGYKAGELKPVDKTDRMVAALLRRGDLLISRSNTLDRVGFVGIYDGESEGSVSFPDTMMRLCPNEEVLTPAFLEFAFQSTSLRRRVMSIAAGTSASMKKINRRNLMQIKVPVPPIAQQRAALETRQQLRDDGEAIRNRFAQAMRLHGQLVADLLHP